MIARRHWPYLAGAAVLGIVAGAAWPPPALPRMDNTANEWALPPAESIARHIPQDMAAVTKSMRWNGSSGGMSGDGTWRLAGTVNEAGPAILVMTKDSPAKAQRFSIGDRLPDGSVLQSVEGDRAITRRDNCTTTYQLFHAEAVDRSDGCEEPAAPDQGSTQ